MSQKLSKPTSSSQNRFLRRGISKIYWLKKVKDPTQPTRLEISEPNRFDLTGAVSAIDGWALTNEPIETPDMATTFTSSIPGDDKADSSSLTFYEDQHSDAIEQELPKGAKGYVVFLRKGDIPGSRSVDVFPAQVATRSATYTTDNEAAKFQVTFTIIEEPSLDAPVPEAYRTLPKPPEHHDHGRHDHDHHGDDVDVTVVSSTSSTTVREYDED